ncbi:MAG: NTP transferase domain-containing protein [Candidatus Bathyarchaeota archaeon]|nr:NTP transferase domain-containing protein [Candidatus Bathyarchaeota archaeon]
MRIPALIMAGGKGTRMGLAIEKPLVPFLGKPLIDWVVNALTSAKKVSRFYVVTSPNTPKTQLYCQKKGWRVLPTDAKGYHEDLKQVVVRGELRCPILTIPADVPALTGEALDKIVTAYERCGRDYLAVFVPIEKRRELGLSISSTDEYKGVWYAVSGVNIVNGLRVQEEGKIETSAIITQDKEVMLNINTVKDLEIAKQIMQKQKKK